MASSSETGHAKNVANFDEIISNIMGYNASYNPSKQSIKLDALQVLSVNAKKGIDSVNAAMPAYSNAVAARDAAFSPLSKLITRILNALKATDTTKQVDESALTFARKIQGRRASAKKTPEEIQANAQNGKESVQISASQMSYDSRLDNLDKLIKLLSSIEVFAPNEADLKVVSLSSLYTELKQKNTAVLAAAVPLKNARITRNDILYKELTGLVEVASDVKSYVKSVFGANSPQYRQISRIKFTRQR
jgi:hypothetical protein